MDELMGCFNFICLSLLSAHSSGLGLKEDGNEDVVNEKKILAITPHIIN